MNSKSSFKNVLEKKYLGETLPLPDMKLCCEITKIELYFGRFEQWTCGIIEIPEIEFTVQKNLVYDKDCYHYRWEEAYRQFC